MCTTCLEKLDEAFNFRFMLRNKESFYFRTLRTGFVNQKDSQNDSLPPEDKRSPTNEQEVPAKSAYYRDSQTKEEKFSSEDSGTSMALEGTFMALEGTSVDLEKSSEKSVEFAYTEVSRNVNLPRDVSFFTELSLDEVRDLVLLDFVVPVKKLRLDEKEQAKAIQTESDFQIKSLNQQQEVTVRKPMRSIDCRVWLTDFNSEENLAIKKKFQCFYCTKKFIQFSRLKKHMTTHTIFSKDHQKIKELQLKLSYQNSPKIVCAKCFEKFGTEKSLRKHFKEVHPMKGSSKRVVEVQKLVKKYACDICTKTFFFKSSLRLHVPSHVLMEDC